MIEVFKTNVTDSMDAARLLQLLNRYFPQSRINFDLHDCDKILRVEGHDFITGQIIGLLQENGFHCSILDH
ncbi:MAG: hypothetical protein JSU05_03410 [Bacteroidetes bacterium]|nr:hypothetical protein [Bacteroidota bacterium]